MLKKTIALAMVVGAVMAVGVPGVASANWKHHQTAIQVNKTIGLTGNIRNQGGLGGIECQITAEVQLVPGTTGVMNTFKPDNGTETEKCKGLGGFGPCQVHNLTPQAPNWQIHTNTSVVTVTTQTIQYQSTGGIFCLVKKTELTSGTLTLSPNQTSTVSTVTLSGVLQADIQTNSGTVDQENITLGGTLEVEAPNAATYSI